MNPLEDTVLITGAARRIGAEIARALHQSGFRVALHYHRSASAAEELAARLNRERPDSVRLIQADLALTDRLAEIVERAAGFWGRLDALVNNASTFYTTPLTTVTEAQWDQVMASNLKAPFFLSRAAAPWLRCHHGCIVNLIDIYAERPLLVTPCIASPRPDWQR